MPSEPSRHRIRLRGPWVRSPGETVSYRRQFNRPTGLSADTQLFLTFQNCDQIEAVTLNETALQLEQVADSLQRATVAHLKPGANRLEVQLRTSGDQAPQLTGHIALEIVEPSP